jgi:hypothetical protein
MLIRRAVLVLAVLSASAACRDGDESAATTTTTSTTAPVEATTTTEPLHFTGDPASPFCTKLREVDLDSLVGGDPGDPAAVEQAFGRLVGALRDIEALAPPEIQADATLVADGIAALDATLAAVGYDFDALAASGAGGAISSLVNDPGFTVAGERLGAYRSQVCGL